MSEIAKFNTIYNALFDTLKSYSESLDSNLQFAVERDFFRSRPPREAGAYIHLYEGNLSRVGGKSGKRYHAYTCEFFIEAIVVAKAKYDSGTSEITRASEVAAARLRLLKRQVWDAILHGERVNLGLPIGTFGNTPFVEWEAITPEDMETEDAIAAGIGSVQYETQYTPEGVDGVDLERIAISNDFSDKWEAYFDESEY